MFTKKSLETSKLKVVRRIAKIDEGYIWNIDLSFHKKSLKMPKG
jgi:hypothetical protein